METRGLPRGIELAIAGGALLLALPLLASLALAIALDSPGPVLHGGVRVGRGGRRFRLWKLRSMAVGSSGPGVTAAGDPRVTRIGRWLRKSKLDELPSLWNVLSGDLSLVGPRPEAPEYVDLEDPAWRRVLAVRPGLSDPVTLRLRNEEGLLATAPGPLDETYRRRLLPFKLGGYVAYLERRSAFADLAVLLETALAVVRAARYPPPTWEEIDASRSAETMRTNVVTRAISTQK
jgi:lipopolysaccharide/colanic/teichoic acid biosynthesis glycosyltransferase